MPQRALQGWPTETGGRRPLSLASARIRKRVSEGGCGYCTVTPEHESHQGVLARDGAPTCAERLCALRRTQSAIKTPTRPVPSSSFGRGAHSERGSSIRRLSYLSEIRTCTNPSRQAD